MQDIDLLYRELKQAQKLFKGNTKVIDDCVSVLITALQQFKDNCDQTHQ